ncbi:cell division cycle-associated protein 2 isoform X2 [Apus apus]|uniref:cell division cycle-associated protein 2 isoform X2 n=1 Tax=Apus apus TaxID=8895 RepID=UPI0021F81BBC|nr:cell division cycle-associated protein 2 isoform X2 [Apus apus]
MHKSINAALEVKENENRYPEEREEASFPDLPKEQKICKVIKSEIIKASKKENLSDGNQEQLQKCNLKHTRVLGKESQPSKEDVDSCQVSECFFEMLKGDVAGEHPLPLNNKENVPRSRPVSLGDECYLTPKRDKAEEKSDCGISEEQRKTPVDFAAVTIAEFGITQESFTKRSGKSPASLKYRRRSAIGVRGSPENNTLIKYLAQQRSNRQTEAVRLQVSPFRHENVRSLKEKLDAFQTSFKSVQEAEGDTGFSGLSQVDDAAQEEAPCSDCITEGDGSDEVSDPSRDQIIFVEELSLVIPDEREPPVTPHTVAPTTPLQAGNTSLNEHTPSGLHLRSVLKKTPVKQLMEKEYSNDAVDGESESLTVSSCAAISEALQTENTERYSSEKPKKKKVTFGEVLSPEIFDETLPANTPLRKGATPARQPGQQSNSPSAGAALPEEPLPQPDFDCSDECVEPLQELVEDPVAAEDLLPAANAEAETDKCDVIRTRSSTRRKSSTISEGTDCTISQATDRSAKDTKNPRKSKFQQQKNMITSAAKRTQKTKQTKFGKRRKKKVKKSLYGEREMASKKPLLSPIPEVPESFSFVSSPNSPNTISLFSDNTRSWNTHKDVQQNPVVERMREKTSCAVPVCPNSMDLDMAEASSSSDTEFQVSPGDLKSVSGIDQELSNIVPDANCGFATSDYLQEGKETACAKEANGGGSLIDNEKLQGSPLNKAGQLTGLKLLEQQDTDVHEGAQRTQSPQKDFIRGSPPRRRRKRRSSSIYFPPVEKLEITGNDLAVCSYNVEEILSCPQPKKDSSEPCRRNSENGGEHRVRRSMRLHRGAEMEGLAWIQVPSEMQRNPPLPASAGKVRRTRSTSILTENIHYRGQNLTQCSAPGKENTDSAQLADGPCKRWRRKSLCVSTLQETRTWSQARKKSMPNTVKGTSGVTKTIMKR